MTARPFRDLAALLARALVAHARDRRCGFAIGDATGRPWASATFEGERVSIELRRVDPGAAWLADLPDADLLVRGHHVADLVVERLGPTTIRIHALLLRDA
ncbi:hypothetical protein [uncultured Sphingomonas sp.]|uniref:hypothetical protein n=1 Tax=uncultured Sphingomonas sp. TaxID=158754 RepID=UPI0035CAE210